MKQETVKKIMQETEIGYDLISKKFSQTRKHFWRELEYIKDYTRAGDNVLDFGCGNGRLLELFGNKKVQYFGVDVSEKLIDLAKERHMGEHIDFQKISSNQESLPFGEEFFNTIYSIAVFHHIPSRQYRQEIACELFSKTKKDGYIIVTVWNIWPTFASLWRGKQKKYFKNILKNWMQKIKGESQLDWNDCEISFTDNEGKKIQRFHHAFTKNELEKLFTEAGFKTEKCEIVSGRNILFIGKK
jgi:alkylated DNA repair protein alkB family protein 8